MRALGIFSYIKFPLFQRYLSDSLTRHSVELEVHPPNLGPWLSWIPSEWKKTHPKHLLCPARIWKKSPLIPPSFLIYWFSSPLQKRDGLQGLVLATKKWGNAIRSACNPVRAFQAAVLSILFGYVKNVEYQQWVSVPYCWVLYELILLQSQKKGKKRKKDLRLGQKSL